MGFRVLVTRSHGFSPFFVLHGVEAAIPSFLARYTYELSDDISDEDVVRYAEEVGLWLRAVRLEV